MNVKQIVIAHLKSIGADGLCAEECGCGLDDFMPCAGVISGMEDCVPAKLHTCDHDYCDCNGGDCYRPMNTTTEDGETHL